MMKDQQVHALRACSLVAIPPSEERTPPPGGFPRDLSGMNLTSWAGLIQDVAQGMKVASSQLGHGGLPRLNGLAPAARGHHRDGLLQDLLPTHPRRRCPGDYRQAPTETWSQIMARMPGQGVVASIGGPTTPGTATVEVQEQGVPLPLPPPGLHPPDFSNWSLPFPEAPPTGGLSTPSGGLPGIGRQTVGPQASGQKAPAPPMQVPSTPQGMLPVHQPRPNQPATPYQQAAQLQSQPATPYEQVVQPLSQPATPYQQAVQPPRRSTGRGLLA